MQAKNFAIKHEVLGMLKEKDDTLVISKYLKSGNSKIPSSISCIVEDLPLSELKINAERIYKEIFYPLNDELSEITFYSINKWPLDTEILFKKEFFNDEFSIAFQNIYLDLIYQKISDVDLKSQYDYETPIEEQMRHILDSGEMNFKEQSKYEGLKVDFEVYDGDKKVFVECDGKEHHEREKDDKRDLILRKYATVLHFTGSEIYRNSTSILGEIKRALYDDKDDIPYDSLDGDQEKAVKSSDLPTRVIATAGAGKTRLLKNRILYLLNLGVPPSEILVLSFNKKNKDDLIEKLNLSGVEIRNNLIDQNSISVQTFHSFSYKILKKNISFFHFDKERNEEEYDKLCLKQFEEYIRPHFSIEYQLSSIKECISKSKNELNSPKFYDKDISTEVEELLEKQKKEQIYTFDDMQYLCLKLLLENKELRRRIQSRFSHILVDEFQDLTLLQIRLLDIIAPPQYKTYITGDDDQLIYRWRGSHPKHILSYSKDLKQMQEFFLRTNYRCPREILNHSKFLIQNNKNRIVKEILPYKKDEKSLVVLFAENIQEEVNKTINYVVKLMKEGVSLKDISIITRYHELQYFLAFGLNQQGIPFRLSNVLMLVDKRAVQIILSYLKVVFLEDRVTKDDWERVFSYPSKNINDNYLESFLSSKCDLSSWFSKLEKDTDNYEYCNLREFVSKFATLYNNRGNITNVESQIDIILETFDLYREFHDNAKVNILVEQASDEQIVELIKNISRKHNSLEEFFQYIENADVLLNTPDLTNDCINFYTIHGSKGMEFPYVIFFHTNSLHKEDRDFEEIEEDRRMYYVATTRATKNLCVTHIKDEEKQVGINHNLEFLFNPKFIGYTTKQLIEKKEKQLILNREFKKENQQDISKPPYLEEIDIYKKRLYNLEIEIDLKRAELKKYKIFLFRNRSKKELTKLEEEFRKYSNRIEELKKSLEDRDDTEKEKTSMKKEEFLLEEIERELESRVRFNFNNYVK